MLINFIKMHGLGNDFVIIDNTKENLRLTSNHIQHICNRHLGIGCDQLILTEDLIPRKTIKMRVFNSNGSKASACGNATRCIAFYAMQKYQINQINIQTANRILFARLNSNGNIEVNMGEASFKVEEIPLSSGSLNPKSLSFPEFNLQEIGIAVNVGNPHVVFVTTDVDAVPLEKLGPLIEKHSYFPERINVEFIQILDKNTIKMRVWERGTGITTACGTGAMSSFAVAKELNLIDYNNVKILLEGGELLLHSQQNDIILEGPATLVFKGYIKLY